MIRNLALLAQKTLPVKPRSPGNWGSLEKADEFFRYWHRDTVVPVKWLIIAGAVPAGLFLALWLHRRYQQRHLRSRPLATFHQLALYIGLRLSDQWLLLRIARAQALPSPLTLILSGATLRHHARAYAPRLTLSRQLTLMRRVAAIRRLLYDADGE